MVNYADETGSPIRKITNRNELPEDAIILDREEAKNLQWQMIASWKQRKDVWPFTYGIGLLSAAAGFSGFIINNHYRRRLKLGDFALLTSHLPLVGLPAVVTPLLHTAFITNKILLSDYTCPICLETRALFIQLQCGILYPMVLAPLSGYYLAGMSLQYPVPNIKQFKDVFNMYIKTSSRIWGKVGLMALVQGALSLGITFAEATNIDILHDELVARHKEGAKKKQ